MRSAGRQTNLIKCVCVCVCVFLLKQQWPGDGVPAGVSVVEECVEDREEGVTEEKSFLHGRARRWTEHRGVLSLKVTKYHL